MIFPYPRCLPRGISLPSGEAEFPWPYLIYEYIPALSIGEVYDQVSYPSRQPLARQSGQAVKSHALAAPSSLILSSPPAGIIYLNHLTRLSSDCQQRHIAWGSLPPSLAFRDPRLSAPASSPPAPFPIPLADPCRPDP